MTKTVLYLSGYQKSQENSSHITRISLLQNIVVPVVICMMRRCHVLFGSCYRMGIFVEINFTALC
jgi:hypothetical protein